MTGDEIRGAFLRFFKEKGHTILPSSSLIPKDDPTLLLTTAGMVQIKPYFLGLSTPPNTRLASCQKCFRTTDIDQVGDTQHLTFFEMLGNFSVGDYFKKEAIEWAWEFVTQPNWLNLPLDRLWITIYLDDEEAFNCWRDIGIPAERIIRLGEEDNFWGPAGDSGPCGPCSEIHYDFGEDSGCGKPDCGPACDCARFSEIWNLVFTQYNQDKEGKRNPLPKPNIDTGMGLERVAAVMQGKVSVYETDLFEPVVKRVAEFAGKQYGKDETIDRAIRIVAEHARGITFLIADGVFPSNEGRGYVLRMLLRHASLFGRKLEINQLFLHEMASDIITMFKSKDDEHIYPELIKKYDEILNLIREEEMRFRELIDAGLMLIPDIFQRMDEQGEKVISGKVAFYLHDTQGFPVDILSELAGERGYTVDLNSFNQEMERQRERARAAHKFTFMEERAAKMWEEFGVNATPFVGYEELKQNSDVIMILVNSQSVGRASEGDEVEVILQKTPFYGEMGGQVGDSGYIIGPQGRVNVSKTVKPILGIDTIVHLGKVVEGVVLVGDSVEAVVDQDNRLDIARNHTATHLLQAALRAVSGEQVCQSGSLVAPDKLRFDFTHLGAISKEQLAEIQRTVNEKIRQNLPVMSKIISYNEAISKGAIALFGEKYGDDVRVLEIGQPPFSMELCGGTHVKSTGEIGVFHVVSESGIGTGMRRIEAVTGRGAEKLFEQRLSALEVMARELGASPEEAQSKLSAVLTELEKEHKRVSSLESELARRDANSLLDRVEVINGVNVVSAKVSTTSSEAMREIGDRLKDKLGSGVIILGSIYNGKPNFMAMVSSDLVAQGFNAGDIVKKIAATAGGGGGGKAELGQGSGKDKNKLDEALTSIRGLIKG